MTRAGFIIFKQISFAHNQQNIRYQLKPHFNLTRPDKELRVSVTECAEDFEITVPFQKKRGRDGAMVLHSTERGIMDLPPEDLKRLVQGIAWRDEHFNGTLIKDIAKRESCSDRYVRNWIMASFNI